MKLVTRVKKLVTQYKKKLGLRGWKFEVLISDVKDRAAEVTYDSDEKKGTVLIDRNTNLDSKELKDTIIHELLHIALSPYTYYVDTILNFVKDNPESKINYNKILKKLRQIEEKIVVKLTKFIMNYE